MSLLTAFPHTATGKRRKREADVFGGSKDTFPTTLFTDTACWQQKAKESEISEFDKRGISVSDKIYFLSNPGLTSRDILVVTNANAGRTNTYEVRSEADPDASAGLGVIFRVMVERTSSGSTSE